MHCRPAPFPRRLLLEKPVDLLDRRRSLFGRNLFDQPREIGERTLAPGEKVEAPEIDPARLEHSDDEFQHATFGGSGRMKQANDDLFQAQLRIFRTQIRAIRIGAAKAAEIGLIDEVLVDRVLSRSSWTRLLLQTRSKEGSMHQGPGALGVGRELAHRESIARRS